MLVFLSVFSGNCCFSPGTLNQPPGLLPAHHFPSGPRHVGFISQWGPGATEPPGTAPASKCTASGRKGALGHKALDTPPAMGPPAPPACVRSAGVPVPAASSSTVQIRFQADNWERTPRDRRPGRDQSKNAEWKAVPWTQCRTHWGDFSPEADTRQARVCLSPGPLPSVVKTFVYKPVSWLL